MRLREKALYHKLFQMMVIFCLISKRESGYILYVDGRVMLTIKGFFFSFLF